MVILNIFIFAFYIIDYLPFNFSNYALSPSWILLFFFDFFFDFFLTFFLTFFNQHALQRFWPFETGSRFYAGVSLLFIRLIQSGARIFDLSALGFWLTRFLIGHILWSLLLTIWLIGSLAVFFVSNKVFHWLSVNALMTIFNFH